LPFCSITLFLLIYDLSLPHFFCALFQPAIYQAYAEKQIFSSFLSKSGFSLHGVCKQKSGATCMFILLTPVFSKFSGSNRPSSSSFPGPSAVPVEACLTTNSFSFKQTTE